MTAKQTAVEWLVEKLDQNFDYVADTLINQAKEMEKQQMIDSWENGYREFYDGSSTPEQYYNETFKNTNE